jgi:hypothetical protein
LVSVALVCIRLADRSHTACVVATTGANRFGGPTAAIARAGFEQVSVAFFRIRGANL